MYGLQVYTDFSGGMDIARGVAQAVGVELELNFRQPYFSTSIEGFWRRWHITMGSWMRDYVFYPLSLSKGFTNLSRKSRKLLGQYTGKRLPSLLAMFIVYLLVGFWHGADWKYVAYGLWNGAFIMSGILLEETWRKTREKCRIREGSRLWQDFQMVRTFVIVSFGRFFTGAAGLRDALKLFKRTFTGWRAVRRIPREIMALGLNGANWIVLLLAVGLVFAVDHLHEKDTAIRERIDERQMLLRWALYIGGVISVLVFGIYGPVYDATSFIYQGF
jgi:D-alanyl-lipoteichoic acid acyltransferase DltB (MBOAT superfamily)